MFHPGSWVDICIFLIMLSYHSHDTKITLTFCKKFTRIYLVLEYSVCLIGLLSKLESWRLKLISTL